MTTLVRHTITHKCQVCGATAVCEPDYGRRTHPLGWGTVRLTWHDDAGYASAERSAKLCTGCMEAYRQAFQAVETKRRPSAMRRVS